MATMNTEEETAAKEEEREIQLRLLHRSEVAPKFS